MPEESKVKVSVNEIDGLKFQDYGDNIYEIADVDVTDYYGFNKISYEDFNKTYKYLFGEKKQLSKNMAVHADPFYYRYFEDLDDS